MRLLKRLTVEGRVEVRLHIRVGVAAIDADVWVVVQETETHLLSSGQAALQQYIPMECDSMYVMIRIGFPPSFCSFPKHTHTHTYWLFFLNSVICQGQSQIIFNCLKIAVYNNLTCEI